MKKILVTSTDLMMIQFLIPHILYLREQGFDVEVACSEVGERLNEVRDKLGEKTVHEVRLVRSPASLTNIIGLRDLQELINTNHYDLIWTNEPVMGIMTRLAAKKARKKGTKVMYMTHGYHFFKGCSQKLKIFYPIEKWASYLCDCITTVSWEDYETTRSDFHVQSVFHIDGIGLDTKKFTNCVNCDKKRKELGIPKNAFMLLSVGELKPHKNHQIVIRALSELNDKNFYYIICGKGELLESLMKLADDCGVSENVKFLGYRRDVNEIMQSADAFVFPSLREGLGLASLEAMASGLPVLGTDTRGIRDYVIDGETGYLFKPNDVKSTEKAIKLILNDDNYNAISQRCREYVEKYDLEVIKCEIYRIVCLLLKG